jgi:hypothetical protein
MAEGAAQRVTPVKRSPAVGRYHTRLFFAAILLPTDPTSRPFGATMRRAMAPTAAGGFRCEGVLQNVYNLAAMTWSASTLR